MIRLILVLPLLFTGCLYINKDVGLTTYQYEKCKEYYDANGTYHKDCPESLSDKGGEFAQKFSKGVVSTAKSLSSAVKKEFFTSKTVSQKRCVCKKSCMKSCVLSKKECIKKCCYEKR